MENSQKVAVSANRHEKVKVANGNNSPKFKTKTIPNKSTSLVNKSQVKDKEKKEKPKKTDIELKEQLSKMIEKHNSEMLKLLEDEQKAENGRQGKFMKASN